MLCLSFQVPDAIAWRTEGEEEDEAAAADEDGSSKRARLE
jgi:hypothetical protein